MPGPAHTLGGIRQIAKERQAALSAAATASALGAHGDSDCALPGRRVTTNLDLPNMRALLHAIGSGKVDAGHRTGIARIVGCDDTYFRLGVCARRNDVPTELHPLDLKQGHVCSGRINRSRVLGVFLDPARPTRTPRNSAIRHVVVVSVVTPVRVNQDDPTHIAAYVEQAMGLRRGRGGDSENAIEGECEQTTACEADWSPAERSCLRHSTARPMHAPPLVLASPMPESTPRVPRLIRVHIPAVLHRCYTSPAPTNSGALRVPPKQRSARALQPTGALVLPLQ